MEKFRRVEEIEADQMTRESYNELRGWTVPEDENGADEGFIIISLNSKSNVEGFEGYVSWVTAEQFEQMTTSDATVVTEEGSLSWAIENAREGELVRRPSWTQDTPSVQYNDEADELVRIFSAGTVAPWRPSQPDMLTNDWELSDA